MPTEKLRADPVILLMWTKRDKCWQCRHRFSQPVLLPVTRPVHGKLQPHVNAEVFFHLQDTHGIWPEAVIKMITFSIYGIERTLANVFGETS